MKRHGLPTLIASVLLAACTPSATEPDVRITEPPSREDRLDQALTSFQADYPHVLGIVAFVEQAGHDSWTGAGGFRDLSRSVAMGVDDRFKIGSTTKMFTATMVLQLVEEDEVGLDLPIIQYLPDEWATLLAQVPHGREITVRQALSHRSGIMDYTSSPQLQTALLSDPGRLWAPLDVFRLVLDGSPSFPPGSEFGYSNTNFHLLGSLLEGRTGETYQALLHQRILTPLGMTRSVLSDEAFPHGLGDVAHAYVTYGGRVYDNHEFSGVGWGWASGGIYSTVTELGRFQRALFDGVFFSDSGTLESMMALGENEWYGMGMMVDEPSAIVGRCFGHSGYAFGARAHSRHCPDHQITVTVYYSVDGTLETGNLDILERLYRAALEQQGL